MIGAHNLNGMENSYLTDFGYPFGGVFQDLNSFALLC